MRAQFECDVSGVRWFAEGRWSCCYTKCKPNNTQFLMLADMWPCASAIWMGRLRGKRRRGLLGLSQTLKDSRGLPRILSSGGLGWVCLHTIATSSFWLWPNGLEEPPQYVRMIANIMIYICIRIPEAEDNNGNCFGGRTNIRALEDDDTYFVVSSKVSTSIYRVHLLKRTIVLQNMHSIRGTNTTHQTKTKHCLRLFFFFQFTFLFYYQKARRAHWLGLLFVRFDWKYKLKWAANTMFALKVLRALGNTLTQP